MDLTTLIWLFLIFAAFTPALQRRYQEACRRFVMQRFEKKRKSRATTLIHRQETMSFLGIPFTRCLDVDDSKQVLRAVHLTPEDMHVDLILDTPGGLVLAAEQIAQALVRKDALIAQVEEYLATYNVQIYSMSMPTRVQDPKEFAEHKDRASIWMRSVERAWFSIPSLASGSQEYVSPGVAESLAIC